MRDVDASFRRTAEEVCRRDASDGRRANQTRVPPLHSCRASHPPPRRETMRWRCCARESVRDFTPSSAPPGAKLRPWTVRTTPAPERAKEGTAAPDFSPRPRGQPPAPLDISVSEEPEPTTSASATSSSSSSSGTGTTERIGSAQAQVFAQRREEPRYADASFSRAAGQASLGLTRDPTTSTSSRRPPRERVRWRRALTWLTTNGIGRCSPRLLPRAATGLWHEWRAAWCDCLPIARRDFKSHPDRLSDETVQFPVRIYRLVYSMARAEVTS